MDKKSRKSTAFNSVGGTLGASIREVRRSTGLNQAEFGKQLGVSQAAVSHWENDSDKPGLQVLSQLAEMTNHPSMVDFVSQFVDASGMGHLILGQCKAFPEKQTPTSTREVVQLRNANAAGTPRALDKSEADAVLDLPSDWFPSGGQVFAFRNLDDSMAPVIGQGYLVFVDTSKREPPYLVDRMVVVRDNDQVTIRWLQRDRNQYLLVPYTTSKSPVRILRLPSRGHPSRGAVHAIVGEVVMWTGHPMELSTTSPTAWVIKVRAEIEERLRELAVGKHPSLRDTHPTRGTGARGREFEGAVTSLLKITQIDHDLATQIKKICELGNMAAHGGRISPDQLEHVRRTVPVIRARLDELAPN